ncbi:MAG: hypothetical protein KJI69_03880 [Patescibacteria group bacterium]|nr:hypothetical protein [Patescibacteria group bacterium]
MVKGIGGLGFLDKRHCEKTSFITAGAFAGLIYFGYLALVQNSFPTFQFPFIQEPITWLLLFAVIFVGGYGGVIFYRYTNKKCLACKETLMFWNASA